MSKSIADALIEAIGGNDEVQAPRSYLDTGFAPLNKVISGTYERGVPSGRIIEIFGPSAAGKTAIATSIMASAQKAGGIAAFNDHERAFDVRLAQRLGLDVSPGKWIFKTPDTFEQSVNMAMKAAEAIRTKKLIPAGAPIVWVFDSLASMVPRSKFEKMEGGEDLNMNDSTALARATSQILPALAIWCEKWELSAVFLNQVRLKPGVVYGDPTTTPGGGAMEYYASVRLKLGKSALVAGTGSDKERIGARITAEVVKNKVSRPFLKTQWDFVFDGTSGKFDVTGSLIDHMLEEGILTKSGNFIEFDGKKFYRGALIEKIEAESRLPELMAMLPKAA